MMYRGEPSLEQGFWLGTINLLSVLDQRLIGDQTILRRLPGWLLLNHLTPPTGETCRTLIHPGVKNVYMGWLPRNFCRRGEFTKLWMSASGEEP